jgi:integrase/recombinase XerD
MGECRVFGKGDKEGIALVPAKVMIMISRFIRNTKFEDLNSFLFVEPGSKYNFNSLARTWQKRLSAAAVSAGVSKLDQKGNIIKETAVHPHRLRHAYATHLIIDLHMDMVKVKELLRHSDISSTQIYTYVSKQNLKDDLENTL